MSNKIYYFTNIAPHYRTKLWSLLAGEQFLDVHFVFGQSYTKNRIKFIHISYPPFKATHICQVKNISIREVLVWQKGVIKIALFKKMDTAIFLGDMFILSNWIAAIICRLRGIRVIFWGHGFSGGERIFKKYFRIVFNRIANHHLLYGKYARNLMIKYGFKAEKLTVVFNSLDYDECIKRRAVFESFEKHQYFSFFSNSGLPILVFIGRLTAIKRLDLLINAIYILNNDAVRYNLLIVGDGNQSKTLRNLANAGIQEGYIYFYGPSYDEAQNSTILGLSDLCVSPGNIGLTAIHSLSYGTPACTHNNFVNQMPEFEAIVTGQSGFFFKENDVDDLVMKIRNWFLQNSNRETTRRACYEVVDKYYNPYNQLDIFKTVLVTSN